MGMTYVDMMLKKNRDARKTVKLKFLVDSGAALTVVPGEVLRNLGVEADEEHSFILANGETITRKVGEAYFVFGTRKGTSKVVFGERGDSNLLGALTLEALGLLLDPLKRELKPLPMLMMSQTGMGCEEMKQNG